MELLICQNFEASYLAKKSPRRPYFTEDVSEPSEVQILHVLVNQSWSRVDFLMYTCKITSICACKIYQNYKYLCLNLSYEMYE